MPYDNEDKEWSKTFLGAWAAWLLAVLGIFALLEWWGLRKEGDEYPPLTYVIRRYVPAWGLFLGLGAFFGWFAWHMVVTYLT